MKNKENLAKVISFEEAKKGIVLKKSALQELHEKMFGVTKGKILFFPVRPKHAGCPECRNISLSFDRYSISCRICPFYSPRYGECPHCHGDVISFKGEKMCLQCWTGIPDEFDLKTF